MPFQQFKLDKSVEQTRGIFDKYIYRPDNGDTLLQMQQPGYFSESRFASDPDWVGSIIEINAIDGYAIAQIQSDGGVTVLSGSGACCDFYTEVKKGNVFGHEMVFISATNQDLDTGSLQDIWGFDDIDQLDYPTAGERWQVRSTDALDSAATSGAREVILPYLDDQYTEQFEVITMNGLSAVETVATNIFRPTTISSNLGISFSVTEVGSSGENLGDIICERVGGGVGAERTIIRAGTNVALDSHFTVPTGKTAYIVDIYTSVQKGKDARVFIFSTRGDDGIFRPGAPISLFQNGISIIRPVPIGPFAEKSDIKVVGETENNNTICPINYQVLLVDNSLIGSPSVTGLF